MRMRTDRLGQVSDIDLRLLKMFCCVVEDGGISAAEVRLGVSRSTIGTHLKELESRLGLVLCHRGRSGFRLTPKGEEIYAITQEFLEELERFRSRINDVDESVSGELKIALIDNLIWEEHDILTRTFADFFAAGSKVELIVRHASPDEIEKALLDQTIDIGIVSALHSLPSLNYELLYEERNDLYCGNGHPLFAIDDHCITDDVLKSTAYVSKPYVVTEFLEAAARSMDTRASAYDVESIAMLILSGRYIGFLPHSYAANWVRAGRMRPIRPDTYSTGIGVVAAWAKSAHLSPAAESFLEIVRGNCQTARERAWTPEPQTV